MRYQDWPQRLTDIITSSQHIPFQWGQHDCCIFAANVIRELTGDDHAEGLRGEYDTAIKAARILEQRGGVMGIATDALGAEISPLTAQRGDVVLFDTEEHGHTLAICVGEYAVAPGLELLQCLPMGKALTAWRVE